MDLSFFVQISESMDGRKESKIRRICLLFLFLSSYLGHHHWHFPFLVLRNKLTEQSSNKTALNVFKLAIYSKEQLKMTNSKLQAQMKVTLNPSLYFQNKLFSKITIFLHSNLTFNHTVSIKQYIRIHFWMLSQLNEMYLKKITPLIICWTV